MRPRVEPLADERGADVLAERLGLVEEVAELRRRLDEWVLGCDPEVAGMVRFQIGRRANLIRPITLLACARAAGAEPSRELRAATAVELFHNYGLVLDDIVDRDTRRAGHPTLHRRFGVLPALMCSAYLAFAASEIITEDEYTARTFTQLGRRVAASECFGWALRHEAFGMERWRRAADDHSGASFQASARVGARDDRFAAYGRSLGLLYHGVSDVQDLRRTLAAEDSASADPAARLLTLPGAIATGDPATAALFADPEAAGEEELLARLADALPEADRVLDGLAFEAVQEARANAEDPDALVRLVHHVRGLWQE